VDPARDPRRRRGSALAAPPDWRARIGSARTRLRRALRPPRRLRPTRAGWLFFLLVFAVGFAALNTGNNLLYLVLSLMLAFLVLSGVLSEGALRGIRVERRLPFDWVAGRPGRVVLELTNAQARTWSHAIVVEDLGRDPRATADAVLGRVFAMRVAPGATESRSYRHVAPARGELRFHAFRVSTRFPFGLFTKSLELPREAAVIVYPRLAAERPPRRRAGEPRTPVEAAGHTAPAAAVAGLREFTPGDSPRRIHWRATLRRGALLVREQEGAAGIAAEVRLKTRDAERGDAFEHEVARAAAETEAGLRAGLRIALHTDSAHFGPDAGAVHRARLLGYLALVEPDESRGARA
jgi:uncharacterized protein (DUF58 family)